jgi:acetate---CoA ligase (ADP-forming)
MDALQKFFYPKSICVAGAITKEKSIGREMLFSISNFGYTGKVFPVNPKLDELFGYKCFHAIEEIGGSIDLGIVIVPKQFAEDAVEALLKKGVKSIILISAGFEEVGKEGLELQNRIVQNIYNYGARLVGPNCMGIINTLPQLKLNATFVAEKPETGSTGFLSQSGALGAAVLNSLRETDIKFAHFISVGNKADIYENDVLEFWNNDANIKTLAFYLESFVDGKNFIKPFITGKISKPVIVIKAGKTKSGMKAASSHTGALSSRDKIVNALLNQFGIIRSDNLNELFNTAKGFENFPLLKGNRIAVITNAGGPAILCVDKLDNEGLMLAEFSEETINKLRGVVHAEGSIKNPVDLLPGATAGVYKNAAEIVSSDENVDAIISIFVEPIMVKTFCVIESISSVESSKPIMQVVMPLPEFWEKYRHESRNKLPLFKNPEDPAEVLSNMLHHHEKKKKIFDNAAQYREMLTASSRKNNFSTGFISSTEVSQLCGQYRIPLVKSLLVKPDELSGISNEFFPLVLKGINNNVVHKTEMNAVKLNIKTRAELFSAEKEIKESFAGAGLEVEEFLVQDFVTAKHELLVGGFRDPSFGPVILFGSGGKYVEVFDDVAIKSCYLCDEDIDDMIFSTSIGKILNGVRGETPCNIPLLKQIIKSCSLMMIENERLTEFDINPLIVSFDNKYVTVDARIKFE